MTPPNQKANRKQIKVETDASTVRRRLLSWYDRNRRDLPWRFSGDPYRIWVSEIMLQQTRVQAVIPYYANFLQRFPDVQSLAAADDEKLLAAWSGLGYYSRARNLKLAAQRIVRDHGGRFPKNRAEALALPGVGEYTAAAVLSIGYGMNLPVLDGNVARVLSRLSTIDANTGASAGKKALLSEASRLLSRKRPGDFNQAMMELGATVCIPENPKCDACPLQKVCSAYAGGRVSDFPPSKTKVTPKLLRYVAAIVMDERKRCLLVRRPQSSPWMKGFWELPMVEAPSDFDPTHSELLFQNRGWILERYIGTVAHSITTNRLEIIVCKFSIQYCKTGSDSQLLDLSGIYDLPVTTITRKALGLLEIEA